jgi:hypothetical protein
MSNENVRVFKVKLSKFWLVMYFGWLLVLIVYRFLLVVEISQWVYSDDSIVGNSFYISSCGLCMLMRSS